MSRNLIRELLSALNGEEYEEADELFEQIKATGDAKMIQEAEYLMNVL